MDGDQWCCYSEGCDYLEECIFGFGNTRKEALQNYLEQIGDDLG